MSKLFNSPRIQLLIIIFLTAMVYISIFGNNLVIDDRVFISKEYLSNLNLSNAFSGFVPVGHEGVYRPIRSLLYFLYYQAFGLNLLGWHLHALAVHLISTALVYLIAKELTKKNKIPFLTSLLFGVHPVHVESIAYTAASMENIGIPILLCSFYLYIKNRKILSFILATFAFFTYEITLTLPLIILVYEFLLGKKKFFRSWPYFGLLIGYLFFRFFQQGIVSRGIYPAGTLLSGLVFSLIEIFNYLRLSLIPYPLTHNHIFLGGVESILYRGNIINQSQLINLELLISAVTLIGLISAVIYFWKKNPLISFCLSWFLLTLVPALTIIPQGTIFHERFLYLPSVGICLLLAILLQNSNFKWIVILVFSSLTFIRIFDWRDDLTLWSQDIKNSPTKNAYAYFQRGNAYIQAKQTDLAIQDYRQAFVVNPHFAVSIASAALIWQQKGETEQAKSDYIKAVAADPFFWEGWFNLGNIYLEHLDYDLAIQSYTRVLEINPGFKPARSNLDTARQILLNLKLK